MPPSENPVVAHELRQLGVLTGVKVPPVKLTRPISLLAIVQFNRGISLGLGLGCGPPHGCAAAWTPEFATDAESRLWAHSRRFFASARRQIRNRCHTRGLNKVRHLLFFHKQCLPRLRDLCAHRSRTVCLCQY